MQRENRRLAAIVAADIAGYSRLISQNEEGTLRLLRAHRIELIDPLINAHGGRVANTAGDSLLLEFPSVVDAVRCAIGIQEGLAERNRKVETNRRILFRIGINVGDVVAEGKDLLGNGVNIASRVEALADPGGIAITDDAYRQVRVRLDIAWLNSGEHEVKNIARPILVWRWSASKVEQTPNVPERSKPLALPDKPSIAALPFANLSGDPEQEYFSDGITDDIITDLSRFQDLFVIARNSSFMYKVKTKNTKDTAAELGVRYVLEGGVQRSGERIRITAQLVEAESGHHLWAERYIRDLTEIFEIQDEISQRVAATVIGRLRVTAQDLARRKPPNSLEDYDYLLLGRSIVGDTKENNLRAKRAYEKAIELDPTCARAYTGLSQHFIIDEFNDWGESPESSRQRALKCAAKSASLDKFDSEVQWRIGYIYVHIGAFEEAKVFLERALELNPNDDDAFAVMGLYLTLVGEPEAANASCEKAIRLNPFYPAYYLWNLGLAYYGARRYADVLPPMQEYVGRYPNFIRPRRLLAAAYAQLGRVDKAKKEIEIVLAAQPDACLTKIKERWSYQWKRPRDFEHYIEGLRSAGLPE